MKTWTLRSKLIPMLRRLFLYSPLRRKVLKNSKIDNKYKCRKCSKLFTTKEVVVDHIHSIIDPAKGFPRTFVSWSDNVYSNDTELDDWTFYIARMFCPIDKLQVLCYTCHNSKTQKERKDGQKRKTKRTTGT